MPDKSFSRENSSRRPSRLSTIKPFMLHFLVSGEAMTAAGAFTAAADGRTFTRGARINDLIFLTAAFWTTHKTTSNCGYMFVTHSILWCQGWLFTK